MASQRDVKVAKAEDIIHYVFGNAELLWEALQAAGSNTMHTYPEGNKRLAMIGDAVLKTVILEDMRRANASRSDMNIAVSDIGSNVSLNEVGYRNKLKLVVNANPSQPRLSPITMTATFEAILGAVYLDAGHNMDAVRTVMRTLGLWPNPTYYIEQVM